MPDHPTALEASERIAIIEDSRRALVDRLDEAVAKWKAAERALEEAREVARDLLDGPAVCNCDEAYTGRGLHEPNAIHADYADAFARLRALVSTESREEGGE